MKTTSMLLKIRMKWHLKKDILIFTAKTLPHGRVVPPPPPTSGLQVRAVYSHDGEGETKMSFMEGDMINIIGEKASDGWQYGLNTKTGKYGTLLEIF